MPRPKKVAEVSDKSASPRSVKTEREGSFAAVGRRKRARALVRLSPGSPSVLINNLSWDKYFSERPLTAKRVIYPLEITGLLKKYSVTIKVEGGGKAAQIGAVSLGIARALVAADASLKPVLRREGLLTRDSREKERKKPGLLRARKKPQFSKR